MKRFKHVTTINYIGDDRYEIDYHEVDTMTGREIPRCSDASVAKMTDVEGNETMVWESSGNAVPMDIMEGSDWHESRIETHRRGSDILTARFMVEYREAQANRTPEQIAEERLMARMANGGKRGKKMVNWITGERWTT